MDWPELRQKNVSDGFPDIYSSGLEELGHDVSSDHDTSISRLVSPRAKIVSSLSEGQKFSSLKLSPQSLKSTSPAICYLQQNRHRVWTEMVTSIPHMITKMGPSGAEDKPSEYDMSSYASLHEAFSSDEEPAMMQPLIEELR